MPAKRTARKPKVTKQPKVGGDDPLEGLTPEEFISAYPRMVAEINGHKFQVIEGVEYKNDYRLIWLRIRQNGSMENEIEKYRELILNDLWFVLRFVMGNTAANHPFVVQACRDVELLNEDRTQNRNVLWLWAREHFKSAIITTALNIQRILRDPEITVGIFSHTRPAAKAFLRQIKQTFETSLLLKSCFPEILWQDPTKEAPKWSEDDGIIVKRKSTRGESTVEAWGLLEGMPTGKHFDVRDYDDIVTQENADSPEIQNKLKERYDMSINLGTHGGISDVIGTYYHHQDTLNYLTGKTNIDGVSLFRVSKKTATDDGTPNGNPVLLPLDRLKELQANRQQFFCQQLLDATPQGFQKLNPSLLLRIPSQLLPKRLIKFMVIDSAGVRESDKRDGDAWAISLFGVEPFLKDLSGSNTYLLDLVAKPMGLTEAMNEIVKMYERAGRVTKLGVEKVGISTMEVHIAAALKSKGRIVTVENDRMQILRPEGRKKEERISVLEWPLNNGKLHVLEGIEPLYFERLVTEMSKFPFWHDDILDTWAYLYDLLRDVNLSRLQSDVSSFRRGPPRITEQPLGWMVQ